MVCKEEVVHWFKGLESHKRIDVMCTLLNMCLPFELRFLGTCLEELGGRDSKELRGIELRVNNSNELAAEIAACQLGDPSDIKVRRKMALYFALIRACNRPCVNELFNTLYSWSNNDFLKRAKGDALQELLLVYTMAANHPVFSFEQRMRCGEIYNKILYGSTESAFTDVPADHNMQTKGVTEAHPSSSNVMMHAKQIPNEQVVYTIQNPVTQINVDQNRGSHQITVQRDVNISPHHIYAAAGAENVQPVFHQSVTHMSQSTTSNVASFTVSRSNQQQQSPMQQSPAQHINATNATNLAYSLQNLSLVDGNNIVILNSDGIPVMQKPESDSVSSGESIEESTPPDTPLNTDIISNSGMGNSSNSSSINKKYKVRGDPKLTRHNKISAQHQQQPQIVYAQMMSSQIPVSVAAITSELVLSPNASVQPTQTQTQSQSQQAAQPIQATSMNMNSPAASVNAQFTALQPQPGFSIAGNQQQVPVLFQQYPPQSPHPIQKSQMNTTYHYHTQHIPINNRAPILPTPNTTTSGQQPTAATYRLPSYHLQPNGEVIYPFPTTIAYMQTTAMPLTRPPSTCNQTHTVVPTPIPQTIQHLPTLTSLSSKTNQTALITPFVLANENAKPITSCFNCGSNQHTGQECQESSMEDMTRGTVYKLDYNSPLVNDAVKTTAELDNNSGGGVKTSEAITHMSTSVVNK